MFKFVVFPLLLMLAQLNSTHGFPNNLLKWDYDLEASPQPYSENDIFSVVHEKPKKSETSVSKKFIFDLFDWLEIRHFFENLGNKLESVFTLCMTCKISVRLLQHHIRGGASEDEIGNLTNKICSTLHIEEPSVCVGVTKLFKREVTYVLSNVVLDPDEVCGLFIQDCSGFINPLHNWTLPFPPFPKPDVTPPKPPKPDAPKMRVLHISDVHIDLYYKEGVNANCKEPLCCHESSGKPSSPADASGYWGDYRNCDTPLRTLENMLSHINKTHKIDYVIWTGDIPPHNIWNTTRDEAVYLLHSVSKMIHKYLGHVPVFPALGNHESSPVNSFPIPQITGNDSISWLYNEVAKAWIQWLPESSLTLKLGAYYSVLVNPGFRIISLNMNYCNTLNWWLLLNSTDPTGELAWLITELQKSEDKNEKVHIIGHIPPGESDCLAVWSANYYKIVNRYESTIAGQFFGHTHKDEYEIFYDKSSSKPRATSIAYVGPSVTTYDRVNPGYRIYTVDGNYPTSSRVVLDHDTYYLNLTEANLYHNPVWRLEYSVKSAYNMSSLLPSDWDSLTDQFEVDDKLFQLFYRFHYKLSDYITAPCDGYCKKTLLCRLRRGQSNDPFVC